MLSVQPEFEYRQHPVGCSGHRRGPGSCRLCPHARVKARGIRVRYDFDRSRPLRSRERESMFDEGTADSPALISRVDPDVLERPGLAMILDRAHSDRTALLESAENFILLDVGG